MRIAVPVLFLACVLISFAWILYVLTALTRLIFEPASRAFDRWLRQVGIDRYLQLVALPLVAAMVGGLVGAAIQEFVETPPWDPRADRSPAWILFLIALPLAVLPLVLHLLSLRPKLWPIPVRLQRLQDGDARDDDVDAVLRAIDDQDLRLRRKEQRLGGVFVSLVLGTLGVYAAFTGVWVAHYQSKPGLVFLAFLGVSVLAAVVARLIVVPAEARAARADLTSLRGEAATLQSAASSPMPPSPSPVPPSPQQTPGAVPPPVQFPQTSHARAIALMAASALVGALLANLGSDRARRR